MRNDLILYFYKDQAGNNIPFMYGEGISDLPFSQEELKQINHNVPITKDNLYMSYQGIIYRLDAKVIFNHL
ncbi:hypothetical protein [Listeria valentina]|uniref:hypothetical protein n=1 Tax=Listeria valentina TaxID=2705293 RepID=UPI001431275A|nr:hypothetical protein [Listeria valentina]